MEKKKDQMGTGTKILGGGTVLATAAGGATANAVVGGSAATIMSTVAGTPIAAMGSAAVVPVVAVTGLAYGAYKLFFSDDDK